MNEGFRRYSVWPFYVSSEFGIEDLAMTAAIKLLKFKLKRNRHAPHLDEHLLRDLGVSRVVSEFAPF